MIPFRSTSTKDAGKNENVFIAEQASEQKPLFQGTVCTQYLTKGLELATGDVEETVVVFYKIVMERLV